MLRYAIPPHPKSPTPVKAPPPRSKRGGVGSPPPLPYEIGPAPGYLVPRCPCRGGGVIATRSREDSKFTKALGVSGAGGVGDRKVVLAGPTTNRSLGLYCFRGAGGRGLAYALCRGRQA